ncbi:MAG: DUF2273 domain-containing protein [Thermacetogeniaceae bacterium]|jgi:uncharacterized membrane protein|nr:DUF2273 domain-containing protein [Syntrophomonadaceae bacterium]
MGRNFIEIVQYLLDNHRGKLLGVALGLVVGLLIISFGFWKSLLVIIFVVIGYYLGSRVDEGGQGPGDWWDRFFH